MTPLQWSETSVVSNTDVRYVNFLELRWLIRIKGMPTSFKIALNQSSYTSSSKSINEPTHTARYNHHDHFHNNNFGEVCFRTSHFQDFLKVSLALLLQNESEMAIELPALRANAHCYTARMQIMPEITRKDFEQRRSFLCETFVIFRNASRNKCLQPICHSNIE